MRDRLWGLASSMACTVAMIILISWSVNSSARVSSCRRVVDFPLDYIYSPSYLLLFYFSYGYIYTFPFVSPQ